MRQWRLAGVTMLGLAAWACAKHGESESEPVVRQQQPLRAQVGAELFVTPTVSTLVGTDAAGTRPVSAVACGTSECLVAYEANFEQVSSLMATRVSPAGVALDVPAIHLGPLNWVPYVATDGNGEYLVVFQNDASQVVGNLVDGSTGESEPLGALFSGVDSHELGVWSNGDSYLIAYKRATASYYRIVSDGVAGPENALTFEPEDAAGSPGQYALVAGQQLQRVNADTGAPIDSQPILVSKFVDPELTQSGTQVAFAEGTYVMAWADPYDMFTLRVRASDGALLDPDDEFSELSGAHKVCSCGPAVQATTRSGEIVLSHYDGATLKALRVDPTTGSLVPGSSTSTICPVTFNVPHAFDLSPTLGACVGTVQLRSVQYTSPTFGFTLSTPTQFMSRSRMNSQPVVASNGQDFAIAWESCPPWGACRVEAARIDGVTGEVQDEPPIVVAEMSQGGVTIAGHPNGYVISHYGFENLDQFLLARRFGNDGGLGAALELTTGLYEQNRAVCNDQYCVIAARTSAAVSLYRVDTEVSSFMVEHDFPVPTGNSFGLVADTVPAANMRTFMVFANRSKVVAGTRFRSPTAALLPPVTVGGARTNSSEVVAASDGARFVVVFQDESSMLVGAEVDPLTGTVVDGSTHELLELPRDTTPMALWFDGKSYLLLLNIPSPSVERQSIVRFSASFELLDGPAATDGSSLVDLEQLYGNSEAASLGSGRSLVAYAVNDHSRSGRRIAMRFVDNDGLAQPPGEGGAGGAGNPEPSDGGGDGTNGGATGEGGGAAAGTAGSGGSTAAGAAGPGTSGSSSTNAGATSVGGSAAQQPPGAGGEAGARETNAPAESDGCGCRAHGTRASTTSLALLMVGLALAARGRRSLRSTA